MLRRGAETGGIFCTAAVGLSSFFVLLFLYTAYKRMGYPFELDRLESGMMTSVWRLRQGYPLYEAPSLAWTPFLYAPLFFYVSAALSKVMGIGYAPLRLVSILSTLGTFGVIGGMVWTETRRRAACALAIGLYASLYLFVFGWFDVGRVDSLSVFLFLLALLATRRAHPLVAAVLWVLAFEAKQTFLPLGMLAFLVEWQRPRRMITGMAAFGAMAWISVLWMNHVTGHWYSFYAFGTTSGLGWTPRNGAMYPFVDVIGPWPVAFAVIAAAAIFTPLRWRERDGSFFAIITIVLAGAVGFVRAHAGANVNAVLPLYAWMAVLAGVAVHRLLTRLDTAQTQGFASGPAILWLALTVQLAAHIYRPGELIPGAGEMLARNDFLTELRDTPGDVWLVNHSYDGILAGKPMHSEMDALDAVLGRPYTPTVNEFQRAIAGGSFSVIAMDYAASTYSPTGIFTTGPFAEVYRLRAQAPGAGSRDQPRWLYLRCGDDLRKPGLLRTDVLYVDRSACSAK